MSEVSTPAENATIEGTHFFIRDAVKVKGPFPLGALQAMQLRGAILRRTLVSPDRVRWVAAIDLPQLFPESDFIREAPATQEEMTWQYTSNGQRNGPINWSQLITLAASGELRPLDTVLPENSDDWVSARAIQGLSFPQDNSVFGNEQSRRKWLIGGFVAALCLGILPLGTMLAWNEFRIHREHSLADREDKQEHLAQLEELDRIKEERLARMDAAVEQYKADANAKVLGVKLETEKKRFEEEMSKLDAIADSNLERARAELRAAEIEAQATKEAAEIEAQATAAAAETESRATAEAGRKVAASNDDVKKSIDENTKEIKKQNR